MMKPKSIFRKILNSVSVLSLFFFVVGYVSHVGIGNFTLYLLLSLSLFFKILEILFEWYHFSALNERVKIGSLPPRRNYTVDMLTTACPGEPFHMIAETLKGMVNVSYPHTSYLCDEGNDPKLKKLCDDLGVVHVTRQTHENAKAGNINNALKQATGEICVILDPDHVPFSEFLDTVLHHFDDQEVGYVQVVQAYKNQSESLVAQAAAEQTYMYYGPYMEAMGKFGTAQAIGANCTFRRSALDSIGGHAPGLTEDMHTSMLVHAKGWKSVYEPSVISMGLVPTSLAAFYQQQLKWSRGTFDLWFNLLPTVFKNYTLRQKLHYAVLPVYFLFGMVGIIDIIIPIYALLTGSYPWKMNPMVFFAFFTPFFTMTVAYRIFAQRWLHDKKEQGLHIMGGILRVGTWWIYATGFIYTLINKKVPYIPTPKEHSSKGDFLLGLPNLIVSIASFGAAIYGLSVDWQPYSWLMGGFAVTNGILFFSCFFMGQYAWVEKVRGLWRWVKTRPGINYLQLDYPTASRFAVMVAFVVPVFMSIFFVLGAFNIKLDEDEELVVFGNIQKDFGGFYTGIYHADYDVSGELDYISQTEAVSSHSWSIVSTYFSWSDAEVPVDKWREIRDRGAIPMVTWEPWTEHMKLAEEYPDLLMNRKLFKHVVEGVFDEYIADVARAMRDLNSPVFLRFAHEVDNPMYPWSGLGGNTPDEFKAAWKHVHYIFESVGAQNITWVFTPWDPATIDTYFPKGKGGSTTEFVDWVGLTALNYGKASPISRSKSFSEIYLPYREALESIGISLPILLAEFGSTSHFGDASEWINSSLNQIRSKHPEIRGLVFFFSDKDKNWVTDWRPNASDMYLNWKFDLESIRENINQFRQVRYRNPNVTGNVRADRAKNITQDQQGFSWIVDGKPFYARGICYNSGHDWEEGFVPLSRKQVSADFKKMVDAGANTIRRYEPGVYDHNILREAEAQGLKVVYGYWFDPKVDYFEDNQRLRLYEEKVLKYVRKYKHNKTIIAWNIGNETWGLLKKKYGQPYLTIVRKEYVAFLENLARKIKEIDPHRPVISSEEHDNIRLLATVFDFKQNVPSLDIIGVNSYYEQNIQQLGDIFTYADSDRPYLVTEFGPKGYWNNELGDYWRDSVLVEVSSLTKAKYYKKQWQEYIKPMKGKNLGGFAFSWQDRFEGTATWFGITDFEGRLKPAYHYLSDAWLERPSHDDKFPDITIVGHWQGARPDEKIWLSAAITNNYQGKLSFKWEVYDETSWKRYNPVTGILEDGKYVEIQMPKKKSRLYLYATDSLNNVITASRPLIFKEEFN